MSKLYIIPDQVVEFTEWNKGQKKFITSNFWSDVKFEIHINDIRMDLKNVEEAQKILSSILEKTETVSQNTNHFVKVLDSNHQGVDIIIDNDTNELCFLEVQPTYASGYPNGMGAYRPPY